MAGLAYSIAYNYLNRVVGQRHIGDTIFFQGGTAYNDSVAAAFSHDPGQGDHRPAAQRGDGRHRRGPAGPREDVGHRGALALPRLGPGARWTTPSASSPARAAPTSATSGSSPSATRRPTGATSAPTATASGPRSTRSRSSATWWSSATPSCFSYVTEAEDTRDPAAQRHRRAAAAPSASPGPCTPTTGCPSGRRFFKACGFDVVRLAPDRQEDPRVGHRRRRWPSPASPSAWPTATWPSCWKRASTTSSSPTS